MNHQLTFLSVVFVATGLMAATPPAKPAIAHREPPRTANPRKFIDPQNMDLSVKPGDNFYQYANGNWIRKTRFRPQKHRGEASTNYGRRASML